MSSETKVCGQELHQSCLNMCSDFAFGFDNPAFSDRILKLLIFDEMPEVKSKSESAEHCKFNELLGILKQRKEVISESSRENRVKILNINSLVLAAKSQFFFKLFTNGMKASELHEVTLRLHSSEESALVEVLKFMYNKNLLSANTPNALTEVLVAADKYDVPSCVNYCCTLLLTLPMTAELALLYIDLPSLLPKDAIQPLFNAALNFLPIILEDISKYHEDIINLSLDGIKLILSRDDLKVESEDKVYDLLMEWSKEHFHDSEERLRILKAEMFDLICFRYMTPQKLKSMVHEFSTNNNLDPVLVSSLIGSILDDSKPSLPKRRLNRHCVVYLDLKREECDDIEKLRHCVVYLDLKREECDDIEKLTSESFTLHENVFSLVIQRSKHETKGYTFGIFLRLKKSRKKSIEVNFEFAARKKSSPEMLAQQESLSRTLEEGGSAWGYPDLFDAAWDVVMAEEGEYFINGILHLKVNVSLTG